MLLSLLLFAFRDLWKEWGDSNFQIFSQNCQFHHRRLFTQFTQFTKYFDKYKSINICEMESQYFVMVDKSDTQNHPDRCCEQNVDTYVLGGDFNTTLNRETSRRTIALNKFVYDEYLYYCCLDASSNVPYTFLILLVLKH